MWGYKIDMEPRQRFIDKKNQKCVQIDSGGKFCLVGVNTNSAQIYMIYHILLSPTILYGIPLGIIIQTCYIKNNSLLTEISNTLNTC